MLAGDLAPVTSRSRSKVNNCTREVDLRARSSVAIKANAGGRVFNHLCPWFDPAT